MDKAKGATFVVFGRTGAGKSSLGNKVAGTELFKVGEMLRSETSLVSESSFPWPLDKSINVRFIDTPGFGDNRAEVPNATLLNNILNFLKSLEGGLNIGLFCLEAKSRVDSHDIDELDLLGALLGHEVFKHTWIIITKVNTCSLELQKTHYTRIPAELPGILKEHDLEDFTADRIIFADFNNFEEKFLKPIHKIIGTSSYKPQIAQDLNLETPEGLMKTVMNPAMKELLQLYAKMFDDKIKELKQAMEQLSSIENNSILKKQLSRKDTQIQLLISKLEDMEKKITVIEQNQDENRTETAKMSVKGKGCTLESSGIEYIYQRAYYCLDCDITGNCMVCEECARVCHNGHQIRLRGVLAGFCDCRFNTLNCHLQNICASELRGMNVNSKPAFACDTCQTKSKGVVLCQYCAKTCHKSQGHKVSHEGSSKSSCACIC